MCEDEHSYDETEWSVLDGPDIGFGDYSIQYNSSHVVLSRSVKENLSGQDSSAHEQISVDLSQNDGSLLGR